MSDERDPFLESLFAEARSEPKQDDFGKRVMASVARRRRNVLAGRIGFVLVLAAFELLFSAPLQNSIGAVTQALSTSLLEISNEWLALLVAPLNSVAGILGILLVGLHLVYRRMVR